MAKLSANPESVMQPSTLDGLMHVRSSRETVGENISILLIGAPGVGKTVTAVSIDPSCPEELPAQQMTELDRTFVIEFDRGGLDSLYGLNLSVPFIDLSTVEEHLLEAAGLAALKVAKERVDAGITTSVVIDGLTSQNHMAMNFYSKQKRLNKWDLMMQMNLGFFQKARSLNANVVFVTHGKVVTIMSGNDAETEEAARSKLAAKGLDAGDVNVNIPGQSGEFYVNNTSLVCPVTKEGPKGKEKYLVHPRGTKRFINKCRYPHLPAKMPANLSSVVAAIKEAR